nr:type II CAAX endopeptidase family protein [Halovenus carboxidivorans]
MTVVLLVLSRQSQDLPQAGDGESTAGETNAPTAEHTAATTPGGRAEQPASESMAESPAQGEHSETDPVPTGEPSPEVELTPAMVLGNVAATQGLLAAVLLVAGWYFSIPAAAFGVASEPLSTGAPAVALGVGFGAVLWVGNELSTTVADAVGAAYDERLRELLAPDSPGGWVVLFGAVLPIIAVGEELLFRAALIGVPAASFSVSPWLLAVVASLAFALGHGAQGQVGVIVTGVLGFVLAAGYIVSGSLLLVVVAHYVINGLEFLVHEYLGVDPLGTSR